MYSFLFSLVCLTAAPPTRFSCPQCSRSRPSTACSSWCCCCSRPRRASACPSRCASRPAPRWRSASRWPPACSGRRRSSTGTTTCRGTSGSTCTTRSTTSGSAATCGRWRRGARPAGRTPTCRGSGRATSPR
ncbi:hypothetical protein FOCC_FOCC000562, partial [Frankliniella occidentalis]